MIKWSTDLSCALLIIIFITVGKYTPRTIVENLAHRIATKGKKSQIQEVEFFRIGKVKLIEWDGEFIFEDWKVTCQVEGLAVDIDIHLEEVNTPNALAI